MASHIKSYRNCFVPNCKNTTKSTPDKIFFVVPKDEKTRKKWYKLAGRSGTITVSHLFCCQDHFNLKEDMENYVRFSLAGGRLKLKKDAVPRFFDCHDNANEPTVQEALIKISTSIGKPKNDKGKNTETPQERQKNRKELTESEFVYVPEEIDIKEESIEPVSMLTAEQFKIKEELMESDSSFASPGASVIKEELILPDCSHLPEYSHQKQQPVKETRTSIQPKVSQSNDKNKKNQFNREARVQNEDSTEQYFIIAGPSIEEDSVMETSNEDTATIATLGTNSSVDNDEEIEVLAIFTTETESTELDRPSEQPSTLVSSSNSENAECLIDDSDNGMPEHMKRQSVILTNYFIRRHPEEYIGISSESFWIIKSIQARTKISFDDIKLTFMKIRLNDSFQRLGDQFGLTPLKAHRVFCDSVLKIGKFLRSSIHFSPESSVENLLPIPFRSSYSNVQSIVHCLEIELKKPDDSVEPADSALAWSEYKEDNIIKYLVSFTPNGTIHFVSSGYGGRISDTKLFEKCGVMDLLPENSDVMTVRSFERIATILKKKKCQQIHLPSNEANVDSSETEELEIKRMACVQIHIERVIKRLNEYKMLESRDCIDHNLITVLDAVVVIAAALTNLQSPIVEN